MTSSPVPKSPAARDFTSVYHDGQLVAQSPALLPNAPSSGRPNSSPKSENSVSYRRIVPIMLHWVHASWEYLWTAVSTHPFDALYLSIVGLFSLLAFVMSIYSLQTNRSQAASSRKQADEATRSRQLNEQALAAQAELLKPQSANTAQALAIAERNARAAEQSSRSVR